jgi:molecular chaperone DnaK (HSP70)
MTVYVGYAAQRRLHEHHNRTIYDAKRFIGRQFDRDSDEWRRIQERYPFTIELNDDGRAYFVITQTRGEHSDQVLDKVCATCNQL